MKQNNIQSIIDSRLAALQPSESLQERLKTLALEQADKTLENGSLEVRIPENNRSKIEVLDIDIVETEIFKSDRLETERTESSTETVEMLEKERTESEMPGNSISEEEIPENAIFELEASESGVLEDEAQEETVQEIKLSETSTSEDEVVDAGPIALEMPESGVLEDEAQEETVQESRLSETSDAADENSDDRPVVAMEDNAPEDEAENSHIEIETRESEIADDCISAEHVRKKKRAARKIAKTPEKAPAHIFVAQIAETSAQSDHLLEIVDQKQQKRWSWRRPLIATVAACLCIALTALLLTATMPRVNTFVSDLIVPREQFYNRQELEEVISPELDKILEPVADDCAQRGIQMEVIAATTNGSAMMLIYTLKDLEGDRINQDINPPVLEVFGHPVASTAQKSYDPATKTLTVTVFLVGDTAARDAGVTISTRQITSTTAIPFFDTGIDWTTVPIETPVSYIGNETYGASVVGPSGEIAETLLQENVFPILQPKAPELQVPLANLESAAISNIAFVNGELHVQIHYSQRDSIDQSVKLEDGTFLVTNAPDAALTSETAFAENSTFLYSVAFYASGLGAEGVFYEYVYAVPQESLADYKLLGVGFHRTDVIEEDDWSITIPLNTVAPVAIPCSIPVGSMSNSDPAGDADETGNVSETVYTGEITGLLISPFGFQLQGIQDIKQNLISVELVLKDGTIRSFMSGQEVGGVFVGVQEWCFLFERAENGNVRFDGIDLAALQAIRINGVEVAL